MCQVSETEREDLEESEKVQHWVERLCQTRLEQISCVENESPEVVCVFDVENMRWRVGFLLLPRLDAKLCVFILWTNVGQALIKKKKMVELDGS